MRESGYPKVSIVGSEIAREGLQRLLAERKFGVTSWSFSHIRELLTTIGKGHGQIVVLVTPGEEACIAFSQRLRADAPKAQLILLCEGNGTTMAEFVDHVIPASTSVDAIATFIERLHDELSDGPVGPRTKGGELAAASLKRGEHLLSTREIEILCCLAGGHSNKQVARALDITEATVKVHVKTVLRKLHLMNRTQAAIWAVQNGFFWEPMHNAGADSASAQAA